MTINWDKYRAMFPVVQEQTYFMTAGAGALSQNALTAIKDQYQEVALKGGRVFGDNIQMMEKCREKIAKLINADKDHIAFIPSVSFGMNALAQSLIPKGKIGLVKNDFPSSTLPWENAGYRVHWFNDSSDLISELPLPASKKNNGHMDALVTSYVHFANGFRLDLERLNEVCPDIPLIINGTQGIGAFELDVKKHNISALVCSCYKWMGCGEGISFLYINPELYKKISPALVGWRSVQSAMNFDGGCQFYPSARVFELGWDNLTIFAGFNAALDLIEEISISEISKRILKLTDYLIHQLVQLDIPIVSNIDKRYRSGIVQLGPFDDLPALLSFLEERNIWVTQRENGIRISLHFYNNENDIDTLIAALADFQSRHKRRIA